MAMKARSPKVPPGLRTRWNVVFQKPIRSINLGLHLLREALPSQILANRNDGRNHLWISHKNFAPSWQRDSISFPFQHQEAGPQYKMLELSFVADGAIKIKLVHFLIAFFLTRIN